MGLEHLIFLAAWLFIMYRVLRPRRKKPQKPVTWPKPPEEKTSDMEETYDFEALRKKIRKSWGQPTEETDLDLPSEMEKPVYRETERADAADPAPLPSPAVVRLSEERKKRASKTAQDRPVLPETAKESDGDTGRSWGQEDARRWVLYDAVFGKPRAMRLPGRRRRM